MVVDGGQLVVNSFQSLAPAMPATPLHVIVKLPYNRPEGAVDPQIVTWTPEKEAVLWDHISRFRGTETAGVDWPGLSAHLQVPLPYLMYRAQVRYEEDLKGLQGTLGVGASVPQPSRRTSLDTKPVERSKDVMTPRNTPIALRGTQPSPLSRQATPLAIPRTKLTSPIRSPYGLQGSQFFQKNTPGGSSSTATLQQRPLSARPAVSTSPMTIRRAPSPPSPSSSSASSEDEEEKEHEENREQAGKQMKELEKMMSSQLLGFARPKGDPVKARERLTLSIMKETRQADSPQELLPATNLIPSIPSPPPEWHAGTAAAPAGAGAGRGLGPRGTTPSAPRSPLSTQSSPHQIVRNKMVGKHPAANGRHSNQGSSASSFSDLSDASISTSALEDALTSNVRQGSTSSRISTYSRGFNRPPG